MSAYLRSITCATLAVGVLAGCGATSYQTYAKSGASEATLSQDQTECNLEANRLFPAANFPTTYPSSGYYGTGYYNGGWGLGVTYVGSTDVNAGMRNAHRNDCMRLKGYTPVVYPICTNDQLKGASYAPATGAPAPAPNICAVAQKDAGPVLVDLSKPI